MSRMRELDEESRWLKSIYLEVKLKTVFALDGWGMTGLEPQTRANLLAINDDWSSKKANV
jgi:hypothetical protein